MLRNKKAFYYDANRPFANHTCFIVNDSGKLGGAGVYAQWGPSWTILTMSGGGGRSPGHGSLRGRAKKGMTPFSEQTDRHTHKTENIQSPQPCCKDIYLKFQNKPSWCICQWIQLEHKDLRTIHLISLDNLVRLEIHLFLQQVECSVVNWWHKHHLPEKYFSLKSLFLTRSWNKVWIYF